jgi:hypothetical protein
MSRVFDTIAAELERPRELSARIVNYVSGHYGIDYDAVGGFLVESLPKLEEDEIDLVLSPAFTPKLTDQAIVAEVLGSDSLPREQWPALIQQLVARPTVAQLITPDSRRHAVGLTEVTIERYVHRLRLDGAITASLLKLIDQTPTTDRPILKAIARRAVWETEGTRNILERYLINATARGSYSLDDTLDLLNLVEGRKPANVEDLLARIHGWQEALRHQVEVGSGSKQFFSEDVRAMHGGDRDQRQQADGRLSVKERELDFLVRLRHMLSPG